MNLNYEIAWVDDQPENLTNIARVIEDGIKAIGFRPRIKKYKTAAQIADLLAKTESLNSFDIFLVDWNLLKSQKGDEIITKIRDGGLFTDIVFYSSSGINELREVVHQKKLEGVFLADRRDELADRILAIIRSNVKKVMSVSNMRGISAACIAEIDHLISSALLALHDSRSNEEKILLSTMLIKNLKDKKSTHADKLTTKLNQLKISDILKDTRYCGSADLNNNLSMWHEKFPFTTPPHDSILELVQELRQLLEIRNKLAHVRLDGETPFIELTIENKPTRLEITNDWSQKLRIRFIAAIEKLEGLAH